MADEPTGTEGTPAGEPATATAEPTGSTEAGKTFTQEELDAIVQHRLGRERTKFSDYDELKAKAEKLDEIETASKSDLEKAQMERDEAKAERDKLLQTSTADKVKAAAIAELAKQGVKNAEAAFRALDTTGLTVSDDGTVSGVEDAVTSLLAEVPAFVGGGQGSGNADLGARGSAPDLMTQAQYDALPPAEQHAALMSGKIAHLL